MKKTIIAITAAAFLGGSMMVPTPASAWVPLLLIPIVVGIKAKEDPNWNAKQSAMHPKAMHTRHHSKKRM